LLGGSEIEVLDDKQEPAKDRERAKQVNSRDDYQNCLSNASEKCSSCVEQVQGQLGVDKHQVLIETIDETPGIKPTDEGKLGIEDSPE
jgi:hypothetical protein